jgi:hypothetical protein
MASKRLHLSLRFCGACPVRAAAAAISVRHCSSSICKQTDVGDQKRYCIPPVIERFKINMLSQGIFLVCMRLELGF